MPEFVFRVFIFCLKIVKSPLTAIRQVFNNRVYGCRVKFLKAGYKSNGSKPGSEYCTTQPKLHLSVLNVEVLLVTLH